MPSMDLKRRNGLESKTEKNAEVCEAFQHSFIELPSVFLTLPAYGQKTGRARVQQLGVNRYRRDGGLFISSGVGSRPLTDANALRMRLL